MSYQGQSISEVGESIALKQTVRHLRRGNRAEVGSGDDAAVIRHIEPRFVITTDTMVEGKDFRLDFSSGADLGYKAVASNLADVAAMGATPTALVVAVVLPPATKLSWLEDFAKGLQLAIDELCPSAEVVGGDIATGDQMVIAVTATGDLEGREAVLRSGATPGDLVCVAGTLGKAAAGLDLLLSPDSSLAASYPELVGIQLRPQPPLELVIASDGITAMMDISDSLALDSSRLASASDVKLELDSKSLLGYQAVLEQAAQSLNSRGTERGPMDWVLFGGEDHSFLTTFRSTPPKGFKQIGIVSPGSGVYLDGEPLEPRGWDSLSN